MCNTNDYNSRKRFAFDIDMEIEAETTSKLKAGNITMDTNNNLKKMRSDIPTMIPKPAITWSVGPASKNLGHTPQQLPSPSVTLVALAEPSPPIIHHPEPILTSSPPTNSLQPSNPTSIPLFKKSKLKQISHAKPSSISPPKSPKSLTPSINPQMKWRSIKPFSLPGTPEPPSNPSPQPLPKPSPIPAFKPSSQTSCKPSAQPSFKPSPQASSKPSTEPSRKQSLQPSRKPSPQPSPKASAPPPCKPSPQPFSKPSPQPPCKPSLQPFSKPSPQHPSHPLVSQRDTTDDAFEKLCKKVEKLEIQNELIIAKLDDNQNAIMKLTKIMQNIEVQNGCILNATLCKKSIKPFVIPKIRSLEEMLEIDKKLEMEDDTGELKDNIIKMLSTEEDVNNRLHKAVDLLFDREFLAKCSWKGMGKTQKNSFASFKFIIKFLFNVSSNDNRITLSQESFEKLLKTKLWNAPRRVDLEGLREACAHKRKCNS